MSTLRAATIADLAGTGPVTLTGQTAAKAWVYYNGTGTPAIQNSANISSITDNGVGDWTTNFTAALASALYCPQTTIASGNASSGYTINVRSATQFGAPSHMLTTSCRFIGQNYADSSPSVDVAGAFIAFLR